MQSEMKRKILQLGRETTTVTDTEQPKKKLRKKELLVILALASELGFSIAVPIGVGVLLGYWLDKRLGSAPVLTLSLLLVGVVLGMRNLFTLVQKTTEKD